MKYKFLKSFSFIISGFLILIMAGCVKEKTETFTDFSTTTDFVVLQNSGLSAFKASNINTSTDTVSKVVRVDLASANSSNGPVTVKLGLDNSVIATYNGANGTAFQPLPAGSYKILTPSLTIPAGQHYAETTVEFYSKMLDPSVSFLLPVTIVDASGKALSSNLNTIYYNIIGNPLAGLYTWLGQRYNAPRDTSAAPTSIPFNMSQAISPLGSTSLLFPITYLEQNGIAAGTVLSFKNTAGVLSNFTVSLSDPSAVNGDIAVVTSPVLVGFKIVGNASTKYVGSVFRIYSAFSFKGTVRQVIDNFTKQ